MFMSPPVDLSFTLSWNLTAKPVAPTYGPSALAPRTSWLLVHQSHLARIWSRPRATWPVPSIDSTSRLQTLLIQSSALFWLNRSTSVLPSSVGEGPLPDETVAGADFLGAAFFAGLGLAAFDAFLGAGRLP